jgi:phosphatidylethanolamine/phosphatidyl-N-methylethanolamine N-methyltransferase
MAEMTLDHLPDNARVVEIGCGFGAVTRALFEAGLKPHQLVSIDVAQRAVAKTRQLGGTALCVDARYLRYLVRDLQWNHCHAVVSSLGLLSMPAELRNKILAGINEVTAPGGRYVQYTYGSADPTGGNMHRMGWRRTGSDFTWRNLPPAHVWRWTKQDL